LKTGCGGEPITLYLHEGDKERLDLVIASGQIKSRSALFHKAIEDASRELDPEQEIQKIDAEIERLNERKAKLILFKQNRVSRFDAIKIFLEKYKNLDPRTSPSQAVSWISARKKDLPNSLKSLDAKKILAILERMMDEPNLNWEQIEEIIRT